MTNLFPFEENNPQNIWLFARKVVPLQPIYAAEARRRELRDGSAPRSNPLKTINNNVRNRRD